MWVSSRGDEFGLLSSLVPDKSRVLDVGHGYGYTALRLRIAGKDVHITGIDIHDQYHYAHRQMNVYDRVVLMDARKMPFRDKSFDVSYAVQLLEHLELGDGDVVLGEMERVTRGLVFVSTPDGFHPEDGKMRDGNPASLHRSGYTRSYFASRGYETQLVGRAGRLIGLLKRIDLYLKGGYGSPGMIVAWKDMQTQMFKNHEVKV